MRVSTELFASVVELVSGEMPTTARTPIVDFHTHTWPALADAPENSKFLQRHAIWHTQRHLRLADARPVTGRTLSDGLGGGRSNLLDVDFRVGSYGRLEWTFEGVDYYMQWMPEMMSTIVVPPELTVALMDNLGVRWGLLSRGHGYGEINDHIAEAVARYPERLLGCAQVEEWNAHLPSQREELRRCIGELGLHALYFETEALFMTDFRHNFDSQAFDSFWELVGELSVPVLWDLRCRHDFTPDDFADQVAAMNRWISRWPDIPCVITHGFNMNVFHEREVSQEMISLIRHPRVYLELLFPIMMGGQWDYPYIEAIEIIKRLREEVGTARFVWGSDAPAVHRVCTYAQSLKYLAGLREFMPAEEIHGILGGNAGRLLALDG